MKRRSFIGALGVAPLVAACPALASAPAVAVFKGSAVGWSEVPLAAMDQLTRYEFAEFEAAIMRIIAEHMSLPYEALL